VQPKPKAVTVELLLPSFSGASKAALVIPSQSTLFSPNVLGRLVGSKSQKPRVSQPVIRSPLDETDLRH